MKIKIDYKEKTLIFILLAIIFLNSLKIFFNKYDEYKQNNIKYSSAEKENKNKEEITIKIREKEDEYKTILNLNNEYINKILENNLSSDIDEYKIDIFNLMQENKIYLEKIEITKVMEIEKLKKYEIKIKFKTYLNNFRNFLEKLKEKSLVTDINIYIDDRFYELKYDVILK